MNWLNVLTESMYSNGIKTAIRHGMGSQREQRNVKEVELREILATTASTDIDLDAIILD